MNTSQGRADRTRQLLLETVGKIIAAEGYAALSEEYLCKQSAVSRGALRYHFPRGRYELLQAFAQNVVTGQAERLAPLGALSAKDRFYLVLMSLQHQPPSAATLALLELWMASRGDARLAECLEPVMGQALRQFLGDAVEPDTPELLALRFFVHGATMHALSRDFSAKSLNHAIGWLLQVLPPPSGLTERLAAFHERRQAFAQTDSTKAK